MALRLASARKRHSPTSTAEERLIAALAALLVEDAFHPPRGLNLRHRWGPPPEKPRRHKFAMITGGRQ